ncbi:conjugative transfer signal peptidase TraF [Herbaspirillum seropedicae]|uniref:conjugative transfer signal peptidase TraF n=1 Tax=Herbaspirillum seropedicae TaxID=964 RepID=UPI001123DFD7|nr:conjugative transfer signal peptidase TraF [Herbaspirillum seropedicae]QDD62710.1 conjugative transfer signal peptidase TraF [Herbaspirillum seropedicae]
MKRTLNHSRKHIATGLAIAKVSFLLIAAGAYFAGARINISRSIPVGLYWTSSAPLEKGSYVLFCPPPIDAFEVARKRGYIGYGFCPGGYGSMMQRVASVKDDLIGVSDEGVRVNGNLLPLSAPIRNGTSGDEVPRYQNKNYTLGSSELLLMSDVNAASFDSRYFGPIDRRQIKTVIRPVITW